MHPPPPPPPPRPSLPAFPKRSFPCIYVFFLFLSLPALMAVSSLLCPLPYPALPPSSSLALPLPILTYSLTSLPLPLPVIKPLLPLPLSLPVLPPSSSLPSPLPDSFRCTYVLTSPALTSLLIHPTLFGFLIFSPCLRCDKSYSFCSFVSLSVHLLHVLVHSLLSLHICLSHFLLPFSSFPCPFLYSLFCFHFLRSLFIYCSVPFLRHTYIFIPSSLFLIALFLTLSIFSFFLSLFLPFSYLSLI